MKLLVEEETNERLDKYISQKTDISRSLILKMLKDDFILVNQKKEKPSYRVELNDTIDIKDGYIKEINIEPKNVCKTRETRREKGRRRREKKEKERINATYGQWKGRRHKKSSIRSTCVFLDIFVKTNFVKTGIPT